MFVDLSFHSESNILLQDAGYTWMNLDDCYAERNRSEDGDIVARKLTFCVFIHPIHIQFDLKRQDPFPIWNEISHRSNS